MWFSIIEYVILRLIRRFLLPAWVLEKFGSLIPYYQRSLGETEPGKIVDKYWELFENAGINPFRKTILEIGSGATNGTLYEMVAKGADIALGIEPYARFNNKLDAQLAKTTCTRIAGLSLKKLYSAIRRETDYARIGDNSIDVIVSNSVLEHVKDPSNLFGSLFKLLKNDGCMIHIVDYRDHFFKYPYHFLLFSEKAWRMFISPGNLYRFRLSDHLEAMQAAGFKVEVTNQQSMPEEFKKIKGRIHKSFTKYSNSDLSTTQAVLIGRKRML
jgi:SAM-dependent methyltransferase